MVRTGKDADPALPHFVAVVEAAQPVPRSLQATGAEPGSRQPQRRQAAPARRSLLLLLLLLGLVLSRGITQGEPYYFNDETRHAMNGVFIRDFLADAAFSDPIGYAFQYYAKYPATALPHWPPLFPVLEGILFLIFSPQVWVARLLVLCFALLAAYYWYRIAERVGPAHRAWFSTLIFALLPLVQLYSSVVMLEIPLLALTFGGAYYWLRFQESERAPHLWLLTGFSIASFLTSQKAVFLAVFVIVGFAVCGPYRLLKRRDVWAALAVSFAAVAPWYLLSFRYLSVGLDRAVGLGASSFLQHWRWQASFYLELVPRQVGWPLAVLAAAGLGYALLRAPKRYGFLLLWVASCYLCFTYIWEKDIRHTMVWIPPLVYFALLALEVLFVRRRWALVATAALAGTVFVQALWFQRPYMEGVASVARFILAQPESDVIYYQGPLNGSFIFSVRQLDPEKRRVVARSKLVVATRIQYAKQTILSDPEEVIDLFSRWRIRYVAVENQQRFPELQVVQQALAQGPFELLREFPLDSADPEFTGRKIRVYRFLGAFRPDGVPVVIPMMSLRSGEIRVDLRSLAGAPWPR